VELDRYNTLAHFHLGHARWRLGDPVGATDAFAQAVLAQPILVFAEDWPASVYPEAIACAQAHLRSLDPGMGGGQVSRVQLDELRHFLQHYRAARPAGSVIRMVTERTDDGIGQSTSLLVFNKIRLPRQSAGVLVHLPDENQYVPGGVGRIRGLREFMARSPRLWPCSLTPPGGGDIVRAVAPGSLFSIRLSSQMSPTGRASPSGPLPQRLAGIEILMDESTPLPLAHLSEHEVAFQIPWEATGRPAVSLEVSVAGQRSLPVVFPVVMRQPAILLAGRGSQAAAWISGTLLAATATCPQNDCRPIRRGEVLSLWAAGLGPVEAPPPTGHRAPRSPIATLSQPALLMGGVPATVIFSGLAPDQVGAYQVDARVPAAAPPGAEVPIVLVQGGVRSNVAAIAIQ
jgi:uncharacterized protein (TIGR03437 family)